LSFLGARVELEGELDIDLDDLEQPSLFWVSKLSVLDATQQDEYQKVLGNGSRMQAMIQRQRVLQIAYLNVHEYMLAQEFAISNLRDDILQLQQQHAALQAKFETVASQQLTEVVGHQPLSFLALVAI